MPENKRKDAVKFHRLLVLMPFSTPIALTVVTKYLIHEMAHPFEHMSPSPTTIGSLL